MEIKINIVQTATELAHERLLENYTDIQYNEEVVYEQDEDDEEITRYTEEAQKIFDSWYDYYYDKLEKLQINDSNK